jgi:hypothetical protein
MTHRRARDKKPGRRVHRPTGRRGREIAVGLLGILAAFLGGAPGGAGSAQAQTVPPHLDYRTFDTPHFQVIYAPGLQDVALRAAGHAEEAHRILRDAFLEPPGQTIQLVVTDHADLSNGFASVMHRPRIVLFARPSVDGSSLSYYDDWLRMLTMHELGHVFHLDRAGGPGAIARRIFGRVPSQWPFFPGHLLPIWAIEGTAVHLESAHTHGGRLHGTGHESIVRAQVLEGEMERLGQAMGDSPEWPGGNRPYVYGSLFFEWMEGEYGPGSVSRFLDAWAAQWVPYRMNAAAVAATGRSMEALWEEWARGFRDEAAAGREGATREDEELEWLSQGARLAMQPAPDGAGRVAYVRADGRSDTRLVIRDPDGRERTVSRWNGMAAPGWGPDGSLVATQLEFEGRWELRRDVFRAWPDGRVQRLTRSMRIADADPHPESGSLVGVQEQEGTNRLVVLTPEGELDRVLRDADPDVHWALPRWSPDGSRIAVVRWRAGGRMSVVVLEPGSTAAGEERILAEDRSLHTSPGWSPDGAWVLWASDRSGTLQIVARRVEEGQPVGPLRQVTWSPAGASRPAVDREGAWVYHARLTGSGWELARIPYRPGEWDEAPAGLERFVAESNDGEADPSHWEASALPSQAQPPIVAEDRPWSPLPTLGPTHWLPLFRDRETVMGRTVLPWAVGLETGGEDPLGRHRWSLEAWTSPGDPSARAEGRMDWRWAGLGQPVVRFSAVQRFRTLGFVEAGDAPGDTLYPVSRERRVGVDLELLRQRVRSAAVLIAGLGEVREERRLLGPDGLESERFALSRPQRTFSEVRTSLAASTVRGHAFSISPEQGVSGSLHARHRWERALPDSLVGRAGADGSFSDLVVVGRGFVPVPTPIAGGRFARSTLAVRGAIGFARGPGATSGHFLVGGGGGGSDRPLGLTWADENPTFSVRGLPRGEIGGDRAWAVSGELRMPLASLHRGWGALPVHLDRVGAALFVDAAGARRGTQGRWERRSSVGLEGLLLHTLFFGSGSQARAGLALPLEQGRDPSVYLQVDWSF